MYLPGDSELTYLALHQDGSNHADIKFMSIFRENIFITVHFEFMLFPDVVSMLSQDWLR